MINTVFNRGYSINFEQTSEVSSNCTTYLASASRLGMCPFRCVVFDLTFTVGVGSAGMLPIKYPATSFTNGEKLLGVSLLTNTLNSNQGYTPDVGPYYPIAQGHSMSFRVAGLVPIITDSTTGGTNILPGDYLVASTTSNQDGLVKKGTLSSNAPATGQHIAGISYSAVSVNNGVALCWLKSQET